jgi:hypothetical protein
MSGLQVNETKWLWYMPKFSLHAKVRHTNRKKNQKRKNFFAYNIDSTYAYEGSPQRSQEGMTS